MVFGFIFCVVTFEFRELSNRKVFCNTAFDAGSFLSALCQEFAIGGVQKGTNLDQTGHFIGTTWERYIWQSLLVALTLIKGYILIDPTYVVYKTEA